MADEDKSGGEGKAAPGKAVAIWKFGTSMASKMAGGMAGVVTTSMTTNPFLGVAVGNALALTLEKVGTYIIETKLGPRQEIRVGRAIAVAAVRMEERIEAGEKVRADPFVHPDGEGRSDADEAVESALFADMNSAEEKKVDFIGALMTSIVLDPSISASDAQQMIETAQNLRYRAFVVLKIANDVHAHGWPRRGGAEVEGPPADLYPLTAQIYDMSRRGLIEMRDKPEDNTNYAILGVEEIDPSKLHLSPLGKALYKNMELQRLPESDATYASTVADLTVLSGCGKGPMHINAGRVIDGGEI
jgi:hypothetical protein